MKGHTSLRYYRQNHIQWQWARVNVTRGEAGDSTGVPFNSCSYPSHHVRLGDKHQSFKVSKFRNCCNNYNTSANGSFFAGHSAIEQGSRNLPSLVPRPSTPPVFDRLQYGVEGLGTRLARQTSCRGVVHVQTCTRTQLEEVVLDADVRLQN